MPCRERYLCYLKDKGLLETDVVPMLSDKPTAFLMSGLGEALSAGDVKDGLAYAKILVEAALGFELPPNIGEDELRELARKATHLASSNANALLEHLSESLRQRFAEVQIHVPESLCVGAFPTRSFNALTVKRPDGFLVLLDNGCFQICEIAVHCLACNVAGKNTSKWFTEILERYWILKELPNDKNLQKFDDELEAGHRQIALKLLTAVEEFALAHELGHIVLGHHPSSQLDVPTSGADIEVSIRQWNQEFAADLWAVDALTKAARLLGPQELDICCPGPMIFLGIAALMDLFASWKNIQQLTHPPATERLRRTANRMEANGFGKHLVIGRAFLTVADDCARSFTGQPINWLA